MSTPLALHFNHQQLELLTRAVAGGCADSTEALVHLALKEYHQPTVPRAKPGEPVPPAFDAAAAPAQRKPVLEVIMQPGTGKALEMKAGQILRVEQIEGAQCVDFNCFNLHDYREALHVGRLRAMYGLLPGKGDFLWSAPPRERAMMYILADTVRCNDVMFARCNAYLYESVYGFAAHTNCHDIQAEAQREYGLTPDDVHDSFNMFMCTEVREGRPQINRQYSRPGDHIELLAMMDVLAVPNVCGNDVGRTSNFSLKPVRLCVYEAAAGDLKQVPPLRAYPRSQRTPAAFRQPAIKADRALRRDDAYVAEYANFPLRETVIEITLDEAERALLQQANLQPYYGTDEAAMLRDVVLSWWERSFTLNLPGTVP